MFRGETEDNSSSVKEDLFDLFIYILKTANIVRGSRGFTVARKMKRDTELETELCPYNDTRNVGSVFGAVYFGT